MVVVEGEAGGQCGERLERLLGEDLAGAGLAANVARDEHDLEFERRQHGEAFGAGDGAGGLAPVGGTDGRGGRRALPGAAAKRAVRAAGGDGGEKEAGENDTPAFRVQA